MREIGISIYPEHGSVEAIKSYIKKASACGFTRIFTCLISANEASLSVFEELIAYANSKGMKVIADINPDVMEILKLTYTDLGYFKTLGLYGIRLDLGFSGLEESIMTFNDYGLKIEINMSNGTKHLENILSHQANRDQLWGCHNFYPHRYSGLSQKQFDTCSDSFRKERIRTAAFVNAKSAEYGPWAVTEGLCTVESHRDLDIVTQVKDLFYSDYIDDVIIGNMFASDEELEAVGKINRDKITFKVEVEDTLSMIEKTILFDEFHFFRGDASEYLVRSTQSRVKYKEESFPPLNTSNITCGDILIESDLYKRYAGELQIALKDMKNSGKTNIVAQIIDSELSLLKHLKPWSKFAFER